MCGGGEVRVFVSMRMSVCVCVRMKPAVTHDDVEYINNSGESKQLVNHGSNFETRETETLKKKIDFNLDF